ncbi:hypothetical protein ACG9YX_20640, partial [Acinetobacter nematophilus]
MKLNPLSLVIQQELNNQMGFIQSYTGLNVDAGIVKNQGGTLSSAQGEELYLKVLGQLDKSHSGKMDAGNHARIQA